jgi:hypothetical protein
MSMDYIAHHNMPLGDDDTDFESDDMSETTVEEQGALSQIGSSFKGMLVGFVCFVVSFVVLWCGATRVEWSKEFKGAVPVDKAEGDEPAYVSGTPVADKIGNTYLAKGDYLRIVKTPEAYAYVEHKKSETETERKGVTRKKVKKTKTTYSYTLEWTSDPKDISSFNQEFWKKFARNRGISPNVKNPTLTEKSETINTPNCTVGDYKIDITAASLYGETEEQMRYLVGSETSKRLGDKRIKYTLYPSDTEYTFAGTVSGKEIYPLEVADEAKLAGAQGTFKDLITALKSEDKLKGMLYFWGGFLLMAIGLVLLAGPVTTLLEFIPFLGELGSGVIKVVLVIIALIISAIFYWLIKLWWLWLIIIAALIAFIIIRRRSAKPAEA